MQRKYGSHRLYKEDILGYIFIGAVVTLGSASAIYLIKDKIDKNKTTTEYKYAIICNNSEVNTSFFGSNKIKKVDLRDYEVHYSEDNTSIIIFIYGDDLESLSKRVEYIINNIELKSNIFTVDEKYLKEASFESFEKEEKNAERIRKIKKE